MKVLFRKLVVASEGQRIIPPSSIADVPPRAARSTSLGSLGSSDELVGNWRWMQRWMV